MAQEDEEFLENVFFDFKVGSDLSEKERRIHIKESSGGCSGRGTQMIKHRSKEDTYKRPCRRVPGKPGSLSLATQRLQTTKKAALIKNRITGSRKEIWAHCLEPTK